jgi:ATP-binding cassette subfamily B protein
MFPKSLRPLLPYLKKYHRSYVWGGICVLLMNAAWVLVPPIIGRAIDDMRQAGISLHKIGMLALVLLLVSGTKAIFQFLIRWVLIGLGMPKQEVFLE